MSVDHHELRRAFEHFLAAKRALSEVYKKSGVSHGLVESIPALERGADDQSRNDPPSSGKLQDLKEENHRLRRLISLLHGYSLRLLSQRDALMADRDQLFDTRERTACRMREDDLVDEDSGASLVRLVSAIGSSDPQERRFHATG